MNAVAQIDAPRPPVMQSGGSVRAIVPQDFDGAWRIANAVVIAGMAPKGLDTSEKAMVAIMHGMEVGMTPMAALQSIAVVNGRPTIWGDGALGLVRGSGKCEWIKESISGEGHEMVAACEVKRKGEPDPITARFSVADAITANLWEKQGPWKQYPKRMLAMRARAFALRDAFADVLRGLGIAEEVQDYHPIPEKPEIPSARQSAILIPSASIATPAVSGDIEVNHEIDSSAFFEELETLLSGANDEATVEEVWTELDPEATFDGDDLNLDIAMKVKARRLNQIANAELRSHPINAG